MKRNTMVAFISSWLAVFVFVAPIAIADPSGDSRILSVVPNPASLGEQVEVQLDSPFTAESVTEAWLRAGNDNVVMLDMVRVAADSIKVTIPNITDFQRITSIVFSFKGDLEAVVAFSIEGIGKGGNDVLPGKQDASDPLESQQQLGVEESFLGGLPIWLSATLVVALSLTLAMAFYVRRLQNRAMGHQAADEEAQRRATASKIEIEFEATVKKLTRELEEARRDADESQRFESVRAEDAEAVASLATPEPPQTLVQACAAGQCVLFVGSAFATATGRPTKWELIQSLAKDDKEATYLIQDGDIEGATEVLTGMDADNQRSRLIAEIEARSAEPVEFDANAVARIPFRSAITSNWTDELDLVWPEAEVIVPQQIQTLDEHFSSTSSSFVLSKLYGRADEPDTLLLSTRQLLTAIRRNRAFQRFVATQFFDQSFFFCGTTLSEIEMFLAVFDIRDSQGPHFALMPYAHDAEAKRDYFQQAFGIELLLFKPEDESEIATFVQKLEDAVPAATERPDIVSNKLKSLRLRNIGAFQSMELDFDPQWNVLLGNNGCGKSTIMKAIAAVLCGEEDAARDSTESLLRSNTNDAEIEVEVGDRSFQTSLTRTSSSIEITSKRATPLEKGHWPVLGFPALRGSNAAPSTAQRSHSGRPSINDVLPLLSGMADKRMGTIKRWLIDLEGDAKQGDERANHLVSLFFELIQDLTPGTRFQRTKDASDKVSVNTSDGDIPIDLISQGMSSVVAWVGELLHRLTIIYPDDPNPEKCEALVLVDELDAHMHPSWQQRIASTLKRRFPNVQFIATTHSPLIVAGIPVEQVIRLERDEDGAVTRMDIPDDMTMGRADQILAGSLFDLDEKFDVETQELTKDYHRLLGKEERTADEETAMLELREKLQPRIPPSPTELTERRAYELFCSVLDSQIGESRPEMRELLLKQAEELLETVERKRRKDS